MILFFGVWKPHLLNVFFLFFFWILGPVANTFGDFWRTVWDQGVCVVIMVTNIVEGGRVIRSYFHVWLRMKTNCQPVETVGLNSYQTHTLGLGEERRKCFSCNIRWKWLDFQAVPDKNYEPSHMSQTLCIMIC